MSSASRCPMMLTLEQLTEGRRIAAVEGPDDGRAGTNAWHDWLERNADALLAAAERVARQEQPTLMCEKCGHQPATVCEPCLDNAVWEESMGEDL